ncbi:hypothetical protein VNO78_01004 [Psophocarpus tetragonolobus]|uniref:D-isomer specific 2-hydroxyacid dehydrogenase catalytic domain-containing protein n=1 Tax=Psophocarpus tetragonolobus TaxID=3891 RepID=A0AAN9XVB1_PSOTE
MNERSVWTHGSWHCWNKRVAAVDVINAIIVISPQAWPLMWVHKRKLTEDWGEELFSALSRAGGKAFSNMAVGYNNVDVDAANNYGVAVGNTPRVMQ